MFIFIQDYNADNMKGIHISITRIAEMDCMVNDLWTTRNEESLILNCDNWERHSTYEPRNKIIPSNMKYYVN